MVWNRIVLRFLQRRDCRVLTGHRIGSVAPMRHSSILGVSYVVAGFLDQRIMNERCDLPSEQQTSLLEDGRIFVMQRLLGAADGPQGMEPENQKTRIRRVSAFVEGRWCTFTLQKVSYFHRKQPTSIWIDQLSSCIAI